MSTLEVVWENKRAVSWCVYACLAALTWGFSLSQFLGYRSFRAQFGHEYNGDFVVPATYQSVWNCVSIPGSIVGALCAGPIGNILGRRYLFIIGSFVVLCSVAALNVAQGWRVLAGGRFLSCIGLSMYFVAAPTYVSEVAPHEIRGMMLAQINFMFLIGQFLTSCVLRGTETLPGNLSFRVPIILQYIVPGILLTLTWFLPESPSWLVERGKIEAARASLVRLYGTKQDPDERLLGIQNSTIQQNHSSGVKYLTCFKGSNLRRTIIAVGSFMGLIFTGVPFVLGYSTYFFFLAGIEQTQAFTITAIMFALQLVANMLSWYLLERLGRRPMLLVGIAVTLVSYLIIGGIGTDSSYTSGVLPKVIVAFMVIIIVSCQLSVGTAGWAVTFEVSTLQLRASTQAIVVAINSSVGFAIVLSLPYMINPDQGNLGPKIGFVFSSLSLLAIIFVFLLVPEMKGRTFGELDYMFQHRIPTRRFKGFAVPVDSTETAEQGATRARVSGVEGEVTELSDTKE